MTRIILEAPAEATLDGWSAGRLPRPAAELRLEREDRKGHWSPTYLARLVGAAGSLGMAIEVCIVTGRVFTTLAAYTLSVAAAAITLRCLGWRFTPAAERALRSVLARPR
jgi:hypothetical protein